MMWDQLTIKKLCNQVLVAHACNPSYSGCRDQEDHGLKPARKNSSVRPYVENTSQERAGVAQGVGPEYKPQTPVPQKKSCLASKTLQHNFLLTT
jgi:hypothetical protein